MARHEAEREDLLAEARALVDRAEFQVPGEAFAVVAGFRANGAMSLYFGEDLALHWNSQGELRRAYADGLLYKAEQGKLIALRRERTEQESALIRHELTADELLAYKAQLHIRLINLRMHLDQGNYTLLREARVSTGSLTDRVRAMLHLVTEQLPIAQNAGVI
jgi:hypothetical protein